MADEEEENEELSGTDPEDQEDEDYVPEGDGISDLEDEYFIEEEERKDKIQIKRGRRSSYRASQKKKKPINTRKKKGGIKLIEDSDDEDEEVLYDDSDRESEEEEEEVIEEEEIAEEEEEVAEEEEGEKREVEKQEKQEIVRDEVEEKKKAKIDELWADFKSSVANVHSSRSRESLSDTVETITAKEKKPVEEQQETIKIKKAYDFAGEEVLVEETVPADSKEAKEFLETQKTNPVGPVGSVGSVGAVPPDVIPQTETATQRVAVKRSSSGGIQSVLSSLTKKPKLSTLEKTRLDWEKYKQDEGLTEELSFQAKDGYLEKQAFLQRVDVKQFELEREERLKRFKGLY